MRREAELRHRKFRLSGNRAAVSYPEPETWPFGPKIAGRLCDFPAASTRSEKWPICNNTVSQGREPVMVHSNRYPFGVYIGLRNLAQSLQSFLPVTRHTALGATPPNSKCQLMGACPPSTSKVDIDRQLLWIATSESTISGNHWIARLLVDRCPPAHRRTYAMLALQLLRVAPIPSWIFARRAIPWRGVWRLSSNFAT